jgi:uncharacterized protein YecE (DUF72 family)
MTVIGCSGFSVPATKYLREFAMVEVSDTAIGVPGPAWVRRLRREAPEGFVFTALAPKDLTAAAFEPTAQSEGAWATFVPVARELDALAVVVTSPPEVAYSKKAHASARSMFEKLLEHGSTTLVWEPPSPWSLKHAEAVVKDLAVVIARDPLRHPPVQRGALAYYRMPGPAGHKSRYEDPSLEAAAQCLRETRAETVLCVLSNVDMYSDAKRLRAIM